jgi:hypothetical protein
MKYSWILYLNTYEDEMSGIYGAEKRRGIANGGIFDEISKDTISKIK